MHRIITSLILAIIIAMPPRLLADNFRRYDVQSDISGNCIRSILQDSIGYIWFATQNGLCRFNGKEFTRFNNVGFKSSQGNIKILRILEHTDHNHLWLATADGLYLFNILTEQCRRFDTTSDTGVSIRSSSSLAYDHDGNLWIGSGNGLFRYSQASEALFYYNSNNTVCHLPDNRITSLHVDRQGRLWAGTRSGLCRYNPKNDTFIPIRDQQNSFSASHPTLEITAITSDAADNIWIGTWSDGIACYNPADNRFRYYFGESDTLSINHIQTLYHAVGEGRLYIGANHGFYELNLSSMSCHRSSQKFGDECFYCIAPDREGGLWLGTHFGGTIYLSPKKEDIEWYYADTAPRGLSGSVVSKFCEDPSGNIWIATEDGGLNCFNPHTHTFTHHTTAPAPFEPCYRNLHALLWDKDILWVGSFSRGLYRFDPATQATRCYRRDELHPESTLPHNNIYSLLRSREGTFYVGTIAGLAIYDEERDEFRTVSNSRDIYVSDMAEDKEGRIWIADKHDGIWSYNPHTDSLRHYQYNPASATSPAGKYVVRIEIDSNGALWFASEGGGICRYRPQTDDFENFGTGQGLPYQIIYGILDDHAGSLWLSSNDGLLRYDPERQRAQLFTTDDGIQSPQFNCASSFRASDGTLYFGGINGFNRFNPLNQHLVTMPPVASISAVTLYDVASPDSRPQRMPTLGGEPLRIAHTVATVEITLDALSYFAPGKNRFAYRMEGLQDKWVTTSRPRVSFMGLPPGDYTFRLRACNGDGYWSTSDATLRLSILPSPWLSLPAKLLYALLIACLLLWIGYIIYRRAHQKHLRREQERRMAREQELYQAKFTFFTQIAHEIKTPLTLIQGPLEAVLRARRWDASTEERLTLVQRNANRLMELIKQLLDFRKIDKEGVRLTLHPIDIGKQLSRIAERFESSEPDTPRFTLSLPARPLIYNLDADALTKIVSNLLVNALKHARTRIELAACERCTDDQRRELCLTVTDDGPGIPPAEHARVFEPFYQGADSGSSIPGVGIGLSLVRLLVEKLEGTIRIDDGYTDGCRIEVCLPYLEPEADAGAIADEEPTEQAPARRKQAAEEEASEEPSVVLVVEDTAEMRSFLAKSLGEVYTVLTAPDGEEALEMLRSHSVDLVVSDIMMPRLDGFGLLQAIRSDKLLSQTPVVLLTALDNVDSKIRALDYGADSYLEKPFSLRQLEATISNLLESRRRLQKHFESNPTAPYAQLVKSPADLRWIERVDEIITANFTNEAFSIDMLADRLAISRSNLQRKLKAITGMTPGDHIKSVRLKSAARMLAEGGYRINEVCYLVGFGSPSYFARCFQQQFGVLPKEYGAKE